MNGDVVFTGRVPQLTPEPNETFQRNRYCRFDWNSISCREASVKVTLNAGICDSSMAVFKYQQYLDGGAPRSRNERYSSLSHRNSEM